MVLPNRSLKPGQTWQISNCSCINEAMDSLHCIQVSEEEMAIGTPLALYDNNRIYLNTDMECSVPVTILYSLKIVVFKKNEIYAHTYCYVHMYVYFMCNF